MPIQMFRCLALGALACTALPALGLAAKPSGKPKADTRWIAGLWESPWRPDQLRQPGEPAPPVEVGPPPLKAKYLAEWTAAQKAAAAAAARGEPLVTGVVQCIPPGFPSMMGPTFPVEVIATPRQINITNEAYAQTRRIYLNEKQIAVEDAEPGFYGHSVGRWEGATLVVDTIGTKENVRMRGVPHSVNMRIDERMYSTGPNTFEDKISVTDPEYLTEPWTFIYHYMRKPDYKLNEYVCENNREYSDPKNGAQRLRIDPTK